MSITKFALLLPNIVLFIIIYLAAANPLGLGIDEQKPETFEGNCTDFQGRAFLHGLHYVPGPNVCSMCVCQHSEPMWCKAIFCIPPYNCYNVSVGERCCDNTCLDADPPRNASRTRSGGHSTTRSARSIGWAVLATLPWPALHAYASRPRLLPLA